jgi:hypothetical protein
LLLATSERCQITLIEKSVNAEKEKYKEEKKIIRKEERR